MRAGRLELARPLLTDGAWGTELQRRGLPPGEMPDAWNLGEPGRVAAVAGAYVAAGSDIVLTNTFRANRIAFGAHAMQDRLDEVNRAGVEISRRAAGGAARVFASIGPSGRLLASGDVSRAALAEAFEEQALALAAAGPDALVLETMVDLEEARLAVEVARATGLPVVACMVFDSGREKDRTMLGVTPEHAAETLTAWGVDAVGANCGQGVAESVALCARLASATKLPIWIKPNAGTPRWVDGEVVYDTSPEAFAAHLPKLLEAGASFVGGCCGTDPAFVAALRCRLGD